MHNRNPQRRTPVRQRQQMQPQHRSHLGLWVKLTLVAVILIGTAIGFHKIQVNYYGSAISELKSGVAGVCLDDLHNQVTGKVVSSGCNGRPSQVWQASNNLIKHAGSCLTAPGSSISVNDKLVLSGCTNQAGQQWVASPLGDYENPASGLCLAIPNSKSQQQVVAANCDDLTGSSETWAATTWHKNDDVAASVSCSSLEAGEQIACDAAKQWIAWKANPSNHNNLLNTYSDGNGYEEWCADFVSYVYKQGGRPLTDGERDGWDEYLADDVQYDNNFTMHAADGYTPKPGEVAYFDYPGGHVEIVAVGGSKPIFVYGDSGHTDPASGNGNMAENAITHDGDNGEVTYYLSLS